jgi:hypothetical protein
MMILTGTLFLVITHIPMVAGNASPSVEGDPGVPTANCQGQAPNYLITNDDVITGRDVEKDAEIRSFIWEHWREHRPGCLTEKRYSKEGLPATTTFAVGEDETGRWSLNLKREWPPRKGSDPEHDHIEYRIYSIKRSGQTSNGQAGAIPETDVRSGKSYRLVFYDSKGTQVGGL